VLSLKIQRLSTPKPRKVPYGVAWCFSALSQTRTTSGQGSVARNWSRLGIAAKQDICLIASMREPVERGLLPMVDRALALSFWQSTRSAP
jgi:hypothetical protein